MRLELFHTRKQLIMEIYTSLTRVMSLWFLQEVVSGFVIMLHISEWHHFCRPGYRANQLECST